MDVGCFVPDIYLHYWQHHLRRHDPIQNPRTPVRRYGIKDMCMKYEIRPCITKIVTENALNVKKETVVQICYRS